jgi:hypothetical protein
VDHSLLECLCIAVDRLAVGFGVQPKLRMRGQRAWHPSVGSDGPKTSPHTLIPPVGGGCEGLTMFHCLNRIPSAIVARLNLGTFARLVAPAAFGNMVALAPISLRVTSSSYREDRCRNQQRHPAHAPISSSGASSYSRLEPRPSEPRPWQSATRDSTIYRSAMILKPLHARFGLRSHGGSGGDPSTAIGPHD